MSALETVWSWVDVNMMSERPMPATAVEQVVNEVLTRELARIILETEGSLARTREQAQAVLDRLTLSETELRDEAARRDYGRAKLPAAEAASALGFRPSADPEVRQRLYGRAFGAIRQVSNFEKRLEEGESVEESAARAGIPAQVVHEARQRMTGREVTVAAGFTASIERKYAGSHDNQNHARAAMRMALDFWGNVPLPHVPRLTHEDGLRAETARAAELPVASGKRRTMVRRIPEPNKGSGHWSFARPSKRAGGGLSAKRQRGPPPDRSGPPRAQGKRPRVCFARRTVSTPMARAALRWERLRDLARDMTWASERSRAE